MSAPDRGPKRVEIGCAEPIARVGIAPFRHRRPVEALLAGRFGLRLPEPGRFTQAGDVALVWADSRSWWIEQASLPAIESRPLVEEIARLCRGTASVLDRSHGLRPIRITGSGAGAVLSKGCALDLHPQAFAVGQCATTVIAHTHLHLRTLGPEDFLLLVPRSFADHLLDWARRAAQYPYQAASIGTTPAESPRRGRC